MSDGVTDSRQLFSLCMLSVFVLNFYSKTDRFFSACLTFSGCSVRPENRLEQRSSKLVVLWMANSNSFTSISDFLFIMIFASSFL